MTSIAEHLGYDPGLQDKCEDEGCPHYGTPHSHAEAKKSERITNEMVYAFHRALSDGDMSANDVYEIRKGLYAALAHLPEWPLLDKPARVGGGRFHVGVSSRLVVEAAQRQYEYGTNDVPPTVLNSRMEIGQRGIVMAAAESLGFVATEEELAQPMPYVESPSWLKQRMAKVPHKDKDYCVVGFVIPVKEAELLPSQALLRIIGGTPSLGGSGSRGQIAKWRDEAAKVPGLEASVAALTKEVRHWVANHENEVRRARVLKERTDMPLERIQAYILWGKDQEQIAALTSGTPPVEKWAIYFSGYTSPDEWHNDCPPAFMEDWYLFDTEGQANNECSIYNKKAFRDGLCRENDTPYVSRKVLIYPEKQL